MTALNRKMISAFAGPISPEPLPPNATVADAAANLQKTFAAFQAANDDALKGKANMDTVENINRDLTAIKQSLDDLRSREGRSVLGGSGGAHSAAGARAFARVIGGDRGRVVAEEDYSSYCEAFEIAARRGFYSEGVPNDVRATMQTGWDPRGGYYVPVHVSDEIERRLVVASPFRGLARSITIGTDTWKGAFVDSAAKSGGWVGEKQARTETDTGRSGMQQIDVHEHYAYPMVTQQMLEDASMDVAAMLQDEIDVAFAAEEGAAFVNGDGVGKPRGFMTYPWETTGDKDRAWGVPECKATGTADGFKKLTGGGDDVDVFINTMFSLKGAYRRNATWLMASATHARVRTLKDNEGRYLVGLSQIEGALEFSIHGRPVVELEDMPDLAAGNIPICIGDWSKSYLIIDRRGVRVIRDDVTKKPFIGFYMTRRVGGDVRNFESFKGIKVAA